MMASGLRLSGGDQKGQSRLEIRGCPVLLREGAGGEREEVVAQGSRGEQTRREVCAGDRAGGTQPGRLRSTPPWFLRAAETRKASEAATAPSPCCSEAGTRG